MKQANAKRLWLSVVLLAAFGWFGFAVAAPEIVGEVEAGLNEDQEMVVRFQTDGPAMSEVSYGAEGDLSQTTEEVTALEGEHEHVLTEIAPGTSYSYRIRVWDWSGSEYSSDEMTLTTPALAPPGGLRAMTGDETVTLSWDLAFGAREYLVQRAETPGGPYDTVATVEGNSYQDVGVSNDQEYYYLVSAVGPAEDASEASAELAVRVEPSLASDSFEEDLDETVWRVYRTNPDAEIAVAGGQLRMENFSTGGWENNQGGVMLNQALDLTGVTTVVEIEYAEAGWTQQNPGFWADGSIDGDDTWNHPGFRLTVGGSGFNSEVTPAADASFEPGLSGEATPPYTLEWVLTHEEGTTLDTQALIGGELVSEGRIDLGSLDPSELYLYLYVSNDTAEGSAAFERVAVRQEPVQAADQTLTAATEETTEEATASATTDEPAQETATEEAGGQEAAPQTAEGATELTQATEDAEEAAEDTEEADAAATTEGETATVPVDEGLDLPVAVQLYSLRDFGSFEEQLALVAETGYANVELVGDHGLSAEEMNELLERYNLRAVSAHYGLDDLRNNLEEIVAFSQAIDNQNIVMPWLPQELRSDSAEGWQELGRELGEIGARLLEARISLAYHNHDFEMAELDGQLVLDWLLEDLEPGYLALQLDVAWVERGGQDPAALIERYDAEGHDIISVHAKDVAPEGEAQDEGGWADVGQGIVDWQQVLPAARGANVVWYIVVHDNPSDHERFLRRSLEFLSEHADLFAAAAETTPETTQEQAAETAATEETATEETATEETATEETATEETTTEETEQEPATPEEAATEDTETDTETDPMAEDTATAGNVLVEDDFDGELDDRVWQLYDNDSDGEVVVENGQLRIEGLGTDGWDNNQLGLVLSQPLNLSNNVTTVTVDYAEAGWNEQNPGFWSNLSLSGDLWNEPGFRLTVSDGGFSPTFTPAADGSFEPGFSVEATPPYALEWVLTHEEGSAVGVEVFVNGESQGESEMDLGSMDASELYFYLYASNDMSPGPAVFESVSITQEREAGTEAEAEATEQEAEAEPAAAAAATEPLDLAEPVDLPLAVQLYSLRDFGPFEERLRIVAEAGYPAVELVGDHGLGADEMNELLGRYNLRAISTHYGLDALRNDLDEIVAFSQAIGNDTIVLPFVSAPNDAEGWQVLGEELDDIGARLREAGLRFAYHNHDFEMEELDGQLALDWLLEPTDPDNVGLQLDMAWVVRGGQDPVELLERYDGRHLSIHVKDVAPPYQNRDEDGWADIGYGVLDWTRILTTARDGGVAWFIVEHDNPSDHERFLRRSMDFLEGNAELFAGDFRLPSPEEEIGQHLQRVVQLTEEALAAARAAAAAETVEEVRAHAETVIVSVWGVAPGFDEHNPVEPDFPGWRERWYIHDPEGLGIMGHGRFVRDRVVALHHPDPDPDDLATIYNEPLLASLNNVIGWQRMTTGVMHGSEQPRVSLTYIWDSDTDFWLSTADTGWIGEAQAQAYNMLKVDYEDDVDSAREHAAALAELLEKSLNGVDADGDGTVSPIMMEGGLYLALEHLGATGAEGR